MAEVGRDGKIRWQVGNLQYPVDAVVLPGERVLVTEWDGNRVGEWDFRGNLVWKKEGFNGRATNAQRLPNGNTFICTTNELLEVDRNRQAGLPGERQPGADGRVPVRRTARSSACGTTGRWPGTTRPARS